MSHFTERDFVDFFIYLSMGKLEHVISACINRAYLDFNRTLHGFGDHPNKVDLHSSAVTLLTTRIEKLKGIPHATQDEFDAWHAETCLELTEKYKQDGVSWHEFHFHIGQAQKWVNMTLKYMFVLQERITGYSQWHPFFHVPIDLVIVKILSDKFNFNKNNFFACEWSRIDDYHGQYMKVQHWFRIQFPNKWPLTVEYSLWLGREVE